MMKVTEILQTVMSSVDFSGVGEYDPERNWEATDDARTEFWKDVILVKSGDSGFQRLVDSILDNGWDPDSTVGWDSHDKMITEGHHRLVAAILLGMDEVPVSEYGSSDSRGICAHDGCCGYNDAPIEVRFADF